MKKNYGVLIGIVLLLVVAVFVNMRVNNGADEIGVKRNTVEEKDETIEVDEEYFETFREVRESTREQELAYLETIILNQETDAETLKDAQTQKMAIVDCMEAEMVIESLLKAKGFDDAAVTFHKGAVNVIIKADVLNDKQVAQIYDIVCTQGGEDIKNIKVSTA